MSPKLNYPPTARKLNRIRRAALAAFMAFTPAPVVADVLPIAIGRADAPAPAPSYPMEFAPGLDTMRSEINAKFDAYGFPLAPLYFAPPAPVPARPAFDVTRDDAVLTCTNPKRGTTAVFRVETLTVGNLAGKRIVSVWADGRWDGFGFADDFGIHVWHRKSGGIFGRYAAFLMDLASAVARGVEVAVELF